MKSQCSKRRKIANQTLLHATPVYAVSLVRFLSIVKCKKFQLYGFLLVVLWSYATTATFLTYALICTTLTLNFDIVTSKWLHVTGTTFRPFCGLRSAFSTYDAQAWDRRRHHED